MPARALSSQEVELELRRADLAKRIGRLPAGSSARRRLEARQAEICRALLVLEVRPARKAVPPIPELPTTPAADDETEPKIEWWQKW